MAKHSYTRGQERARLARRRQGFGWHSSKGVPYPRDAMLCETKEEFWQLQEKEQAEDLRLMKHYLDKSNGIWNTKRYYKKKYIRQHRRQTRDLCYHALYEDEEAFDKIAPENFMGAIWWDLW